MVEKFRFINEKPIIALKLKQRLPTMFYDFMVDFAYDVGLALRDSQNMVGFIAMMGYNAILSRIIK